MLYIFNICRALIRTIPIMQHDEFRPEDLDTETEDHAMDDTRYACMSRPFTASFAQIENRNPLLVSNALKLHELT